MRVCFLALDPGTYKTGAALFNGPDLVGWWLIQAEKRLPIDERIGSIVRQLEALIARHGQEVREVVCERTTGIENRRPAPELQVLVRRIKAWATRVSHRYVWTDYHPSTVLASVRPRGVDRKARSKTVLALGVELLYRGAVSYDGDRFSGGDVDQNVIDAVAVGHCHVCRRQLREDE